MSDIMKYAIIFETSNRWDEMTSRLFASKEISINEMQTLMKDTFKTLYRFHEGKMIPKDICTLFFNINDFMSFLLLLDEHPVSGFYPDFDRIIKAMKEGFMNSEYEYEYPKLKVTDIGNNVVVLDLENDSLEEYLRNTTIIGDLQ